VAQRRSGPTTQWPNGATAQLDQRRSGPTSQWPNGGALQELGGQVSKERPVGADIWPKYAKRHNTWASSVSRPTGPTIKVYKM